MIKSFYRRCAIYITSLSLVLALAFPASAIVPLVIAAGAEVPIIASGTAAAVSSAYVWGSAIFHAAVVGAIAYYTLGGSGSDSHKVNTSTGDIGRTANVNWVEFDSDSKSWKTMQSPVAVKVPFNTVKSKAEANPTKYPKLKQSLSVPHTYVSGDVVESVTGVKYKLLTAYGNYCMSGVPPQIYFSYGNWPSNGKILVPTNDPDCSTCENTVNQPLCGKAFSVSVSYNTPVNTTTAATPTQFAANISSSGAITDTAVQSEIDEMIKEYDNDNYSFNLLDTSSADTAANGSAPSVALPPAALSKPQADSIRAGQAATAAADNAYKQYSTTKAPADYQKWLDAQALDLATNSTAKPEESPSDVNASITAANGRYDGAVTNPEKSSIQELIDSFISNSPFASIINATNFSLSGATSSFTVNLRGTNYAIDFSRWQSHLELFGSFILTSMHLTAVWIILGRKD